MSPRSTHGLHEGGDLKHFAPVVLVSLKAGNLSSESSPAAESTSAVQDRPADGL